MSDDISTLPKPVTRVAKAWAAFVNKNIKVETANNPNDIFLLGRMLLDKDEFNKANDEDHSVFHGFQVIYGPFSSKSAAQEFVADYKFDWPGDNDWKYISPGQVEAISPFFDAGKSDIVHNTSLEFQGQLIYNETQRKIAEIEEVQRRISMRETEENIKLKPLTQNEKENHIRWQEQKIKQAEQQVEQLKTHLAYIKNLPSE